ncbi:MotA/TolQ/ExbB proton channel family protein [Plesiocystis pacifica]|nr:MotA/TolQ/ExbB proton channel family protein [Plesiocystis pacifica]
MFTLPSRGLGRILCCARDGPATRQTMDLGYFFEKGGPLMWAILGAAVVGLFVFFERMYSLQRSKVVPRAFVDRIRAMVAKGKTSEAQLLCEENRSSIARMIVASLQAYADGKTRAEIKEAVEEVGGREVAHLDKNVEIIGTVASITPLLGLLGTVVGMIQVFQRFVDAYANGQATPDVFAEGIWTALITTAYGLMVAIPMLVLYKFVQGRNDRLIVEMEEDAMGIVDLLDEAKRRAAQKAAAEAKAEQDEGDEG